MMSENPNMNQASSETSRSKTEESWQEVGRQFETLGSSLAEAFRVAWNNVESSSEGQQVKAGLESMLRDVSKAVEDSASTPEAQKVKAEAKRAAESLRVAGEQTVEEARPQIVSALRKLNEELQKLIDQMNK
jgi:hypothetical protein